MVVKRYEGLTLDDLEKGLREMEITEGEVNLVVAPDLLKAAIVLADHFYLRLFSASSPIRVTVIEKRDLPENTWYLVR